MGSIKLLDWDSNFFGYRIGLIDVTAGYEEYDILLQNAISDGFKLVYIKDINLINFPTVLFSKYDITLVDTKVLYSKNLKSGIVSCKSEFLSPQDNINDIYALAYESGVYSRFRIDSHFSDEEFKQLYRTWIDNSLTGIFADDIIIFKENNEICGFITVKYNKEYSVIGLIAVSPKYRGKKIGHDLIKKVEAESIKRGCQRLEVATQNANIDACKFYEKLEFEVRETTNIYHVWL